MNTSNSDTGLVSTIVRGTSPRLTVNLISGILRNNEATIVSRMNSMCSIIDAIQLTPANINNSAYLEEIIGITVFIQEKGTQEYIKTHLDSTDFPIHPVILALYQRNKPADSNVLLTENNKAVDGIMNNGTN